ncbi:hypothetical protein J4402_01760 [Candidatus Pacearchaeota archaeon]|nr:hypothetical protein [Candidatus Pacearchaeota archaeon]
MAKIKLSDVIFWLIIIAIVAIAIWKLFGSPTDTSSIIAIALFVAGSELIIWKYVFNLEKKTAVSFTKLKYEINKRFDTLENLIKQK